MLFSKKLIPLALSTLTLGTQVVSLPFSSVGIFQDGIARESQDVAEDQKLRGIARKLQAADGERIITLQVSSSDPAFSDPTVDEAVVLDITVEEAITVEEKKEEEKKEEDTATIDSDRRDQLKNTGEKDLTKDTTINQKKIEATPKTGSTMTDKVKKEREKDSTKKESKPKKTPEQGKKTPDCEDAKAEYETALNTEKAKLEKEYQEALNVAQSKFKSEMNDLQNKHQATQKELEETKKKMKEQQDAQAKGKQEKEALASKLKKETQQLSKEKQAHQQCSKKSNEFEKKYESSEKEMKKLQRQNAKCQTESVETAKRVEALNQKLEKMTVDYDDTKRKLDECSKPKKPVLRPLEAYVEVDASASHFIPANDIDGNFLTAGSQLVQDGRVTIQDNKFSPKEAYFHMKCTATSSRDHKDHVYRNKEFFKRRSATSSPSSSPSSSPTTKSEKKKAKKEYCENYYKPNISEQQNLIKQRLQPEKEKITRFMVHGGPQRAMCEFSICVEDDCLLMSSTGRVHFGPFNREDPDNVPRINGRVVGCDFDDRKPKGGKRAVDISIDARKSSGHKQIDDKNHRMGGEMCLGYMAGGVRITTLELPSRDAKSFRYHIQVEPNLLSQLGSPLKDFTSVQVLDNYAFYSTYPGYG